MRRVVSIKAPAPASAAGVSAGFGGWRESAIAGGVLLVTFCAYLRSLGNRFSLDDLDMIVGNRLIGQWSFIWRSLLSDPYWYRDPAHLPQSSYYRPLQDIWLAIQFHLFGLNPMPWHLSLVLLHLVGVWFVFKIAMQVADDVRIAALAALLFGLIPLHAEAVAWEPGVDMSLSGVLELAAFYFFITRSTSTTRWLPALLFYTAALLTHEAAVLFPALIALYVFLIEPLGAPASWEGKLDTILARLRRSLICAVPFVGDAIGYLIARRLSLGFLFHQPGWITHLTPALTILTLPRVIVGYIALLAMPWLAGPRRAMLTVSSASSPHFWGPVAIVLVLAAAFAAAVRNHPHRRRYLFFAAWIAVAMAPVVNLRLFFDRAFVQDRYLYFASVGWCLMVADFAVSLADRSKIIRRIVWAATAAFLIVCTAVLWQVQYSWRDNEAFYAALIEKSPDQVDGYYGLGVALRDRSDLAGAQREFKAALELDPQSAALYDLGVVDSQLGHIKQAAAEQEEGLKRLASPPADAYVGLAQVYDLTGDQAKSEAALKQAESLPGGAHVAALARAQLKYNHGDLPGAEAILRDLTANDPNDPRAWTMLGMTAIREKNHQQALDCFLRAQALSPRDPFARVMTGLALHKLGRDQEALTQCRAALAIAPNDRNAQALIATIQREAHSGQSAGAR